MERAEIVEGVPDRDGAQCFPIFLLKAFVSRVRCRQPINCRIEAKRFGRDRKGVLVCEKCERIMGQRVKNVQVRDVEMGKRDKATTDVFVEGVRDAIAPERSSRSPPMASAGTLPLKYRPWR